MGGIFEHPQRFEISSDEKTSGQNDNFVPNKEVGGVLYSGNFMEKERDKIRILFLTEK